MKKFLVALLVMLGLNLVADDIKLWENSTLNKIVQKGVLTVGLEPGYMPFEMKDKQGNIIGFDVDMANEMATAGPAYMAAAEPVSTNIPAPITQPIPSNTRFIAVRCRFNELFCCASASSSNKVFFINRFLNM